MLALLKKLLLALWNMVKKKVYQFLKRWALLGFLVLFAGFVGIVFLVWIMVAGW